MTYADEVLADSPLSYWRLEETSGPTATDEQGVRDGSVVGANMDVAGQVGSAASCDGVDDRISVGETPTSMAALTCEALVRRPSGASGSIGQIICADQNGSFRAFHFRVTTDHKIQFIKIPNGTVTVTGTTTLNDDEWHHVVGTYDGSTMRVYVDGTEEDSGAATGGVTPGTAVSINIGRNGRGPQEHLHGDVDELAIYDYALSPTRIQAHYDAAFGASGPEQGEASGAGSGVGQASAATPVTATASGAGQGVGSATAATAPQGHAQGAGHGVGTAAASVPVAASAEGAGSGTAAASATTAVTGQTAGAGQGTGAAAASVPVAASAAGAGEGVGSATATTTVAGQASGAGQGVGQVTTTTGPEQASAEGAGTGTGTAAAATPVTAAAAGAGAGVGTADATTVTGAASAGAGEGTGAATATTTVTGLAAGAGAGHATATASTPVTAQAAGVGLGVGQVNTIPLRDLVVTVGAPVAEWATGETVGGWTTRQVTGEWTTGPIVDRTPA